MLRSCGFLKYSLLFLLLTLVNMAHAIEIVAVVSPRNGVDALSGAHRFMQENPTQRIYLRTTDQFKDLSEDERRALLIKADIVFLGGVFGDSASLIKTYTTPKSPVAIKSLVAVHSDRRLVAASHIGNIPMLAGADVDELMKDPPADVGLDVMQWSQQRLKKYSRYYAWLLSKTFWADRDTHNIDGLFRHLSKLSGAAMTVPTPRLQPPMRLFIDDHEVKEADVSLDSAFQWIAVIDYETGSRPGEQQLIDDLCNSLISSRVKCLRVLAKWGGSTVRAVKFLTTQKPKIGAVVSLQNFLLGGGGGRAEVNEALEELDVPIIKGLRLADSTAGEWRMSEAGIKVDSVHYRVAMPELQGISQPMVLAAMSEAKIDSLTGLLLAQSAPIESQVSLLSRRIQRWLALRNKSNNEKKLAIIYYNHPPGRHNIGADNLNVPNSLLEILTQLKKQGYHTGLLPKNPEALLDMLQDRGVNMPENRTVLKEMAAKVVTVSAQQYQQWFDTLPDAIRNEMEHGPLAYLHAMLETAVAEQNPEIAQRLTRRVTSDLKHAVEGANHKARDRVLNLLSQLETHYNGASTEIDWAQAQKLVEAITASDIEGVRGWGKAPGTVMVHDNQLLIPGIQFGNIFVGPQPPRGWELNEEILHANLSFPPTHQYLAFYQWIRNKFSADALVHVGRHSTYEFLPRHRVGLGELDYAISLIDDLPSVYPYIVDGVGEGIQAKRRGFAVMVDHLTPPLDSTELYDRLLELRQLVESYEAAPESAFAMKQKSVAAIKELVVALKLNDELTASMAGELEVRGVNTYDQVDDELLVHEVGHYLTKMQEDFMPLGLHTFGKNWSKEAVQTMLTSMAQDRSDNIQTWAEALKRSPHAEMLALLHGLNGGYIKPGKGNDPIRTPEVLPTGRNFFALDGSLIPSRIGYQVGVDLATKARASTKADDADAIVLWASDVVRDEGAMIAFGFDMLGIKPVWSSRGIVKRLQRLDISQLQENGKPRIRRDTLFTSSGLFRDLYGAHIIWLEQAVLMALDASSDEIRHRYPALTLALNAALEPLEEKQKPGVESLDINHVAAQWVIDTRRALQKGFDAKSAGRHASYRIFGDAPGTYGAGVNRMVERSGSWDDRADIAKVYVRRMGHAYGATLQGEALQEVFTQRLNNVGNTYLGRSSNLYGLLDNNDTFDYLGGLSLAVETIKGDVPNSFILAHSDSHDIRVEPLNVALLTELRGRFLNPQWLKPLMKEGYSGARTMGSEFFEYLWGWQVTNPELVKSWVWDEVKSVYIDDSHQLGLSDFLEENHNVHIKANMLAVMLVAADKGYWQADQATLETIAQQFVDLIIDNGLPGSGHTTPSNPMYQFIEQYIDEASAVELKTILDDATIETSNKSTPSTISEISASDSAANNSVDETDQPSKEQNQSVSEILNVKWLGFLAALLAVIGMIRGARIVIKP